MIIRDTDQSIYPEGALILAPLSGYTDWAYRRAARLCGCRFCFTEMVDCSSLVYASHRGELMLHRGEDEEFLGVQLVGAIPEHLKIAAEKLNEQLFPVGSRPEPAVRLVAEVLPQKPKNLLLLQTAVKFLRMPGMR